PARPRGREPAVSAQGRVPPARLGPTAGARSRAPRPCPREPGGGPRHGRVRLGPAGPRPFLRRSDRAPRRGRAPRAAHRRSAAPRVQSDPQPAAGAGGVDAAGRALTVTPLVTGRPFGVATTRALRVASQERPSRPARARGPATTHTGRGSDRHRG